MNQFVSLYCIALPAETLNLGFNFFSGTIPETIGQLRNLTILDLELNLLNGTMPASIGELSNLGKSAQGMTIAPCRWILMPLFTEYLGLQGTELSGIIPSTIGQLRKLADLQLQENQLSGSLPSEIGQMESIKEINVGNNSLTGTVPTELGQLENLDSLLLDANMLSGNIPNEICALAPREIVRDCTVACSCCPQQCAE